LLATVTLSFRAGLCRQACGLLGFFAGCLRGRFWGVVFTATDRANSATATACSPALEFRPASTLAADGWGRSGPDAARASAHLSRLSLGAIGAIGGIDASKSRRVNLRRIYLLGAGSSLKSRLGDGCEGDSMEQHSESSRPVARWAESSDRLGDALAQCMLRADAGERLDVDAVLVEYADVASELRDYFEAAGLIFDGVSIGDDHAVPQLPCTRGEYELLKLIGHGGMGRVFQAWQDSLRREVAYKELHPSALGSERLTQRLITEAQIAGKLKHPNIVTVYDVGVWEHNPFLVMEYVEGADLSTLTRDSPLPATRAAQYILAAARALEYAHGEGVIHRDLKPSNLLVSSHDDRVRVADFGLAKDLGGDGEFSRSGERLGTVSYMAPEQTLGRTLDPRADVYALGATLYALLVGRPPFRAPSDTETIHQILHADPVAPRSLNASVPLDLDTICLACLRKRPEDRYQSAQQLADDLERFLTDRPIQARRVGPVERAWIWAKRNRAIAALLVTILIVNIAYATTATTLWRYAVTNRDKARENFERHFAFIKDHYANPDDSLDGKLIPPDVAQAAIDQYETLLRESPQDTRLQNHLGFANLLLAGGLGRRTPPGLEAFNRGLDVLGRLVDAGELHGKDLAAYGNAFALTATPDMLPGLIDLMATGDHPDCVRVQADAAANLGLRADKPEDRLARYEEAYQLYRSIEAPLPTALPHLSQLCERYADAVAQHDAARSEQLLREAVAIRRQLMDEARQEGDRTAYAAQAVDLAKILHRIPLLASESEQEAKHLEIATECEALLREMELNDVTLHKMREMLVYEYNNLWLYYAAKQLYAQGRSWQAKLFAISEDVLPSPLAVDPQVRVMVGRARIDAGSLALQWDGDAQAAIVSLQRGVEIFAEADEWLGQLSDEDRAAYEPACKEALVYAAMLGGRLLLTQGELQRAKEMLELAIDTAAKDAGQSGSTQQDAAAAQQLLAECTKQIDAESSAESSAAASAAATAGNEEAP
jgi:serine/threonine protein kinase